MSIYIDLLQEIQLLKTCNKTQQKALSRIKAEREKLRATIQDLRDQMAKLLCNVESQKTKRNQRGRARTNPGLGLGISQGQIN